MEYKPATAKEVLKTGFLILLYFTLLVALFWAFGYGAALASLPSNLKFYVGAAIMVSSLLSIVGTLYVGATRAFRKEKDATKKEDTKPQLGGNDLGGDRDYRE